jgi:hypothetical protein
MASSLRCKITGCDLDPCGVCRRCGSEAEAKHQWEEAERERPCFPRKVCSVCGAERESPDHDWEMTTGVSQDIPVLKCRRCGMSI